MNLNQLGWHNFFETQYQADKSANRFPGRIANVQKSSYLIYSEQGEHRARLAGAIRHQMANGRPVPVVGDWVSASWKQGDEFAIIHAIFISRNSLSRTASGSRDSKIPIGTDRQIIAANIDTVFIVTGLDRDFNLRRIERYLTLVYDSRSFPVIVLNKADLCRDIEQRRIEVESIAFGVPVTVSNAQSGEGIGAIHSYIQPGFTAAFLGSSGVGKSTLINALLGDSRQKTQAVSHHIGKGRHTTTTRELICLPAGGIVIDTPGMRELQLSEADDGIESTFEDIEAFARHCRFSDCRHDGEPGCAVQSALENGTLDKARFENYVKLRKEQAYFNDRQTKNSHQIEKERWKPIKTQFRKQLKSKKRYDQY